MIPVAAPTVSEANHIAKEESGQGTIRGCFTKRRELLRRFLLMGSACLTVYCNSAFCSDPLAEIPAASTSAAQSTAAAGLTKRPPTVADSIQMTRLGDLSYTNGEPSKGIVAKISPDGKHFVVILKKGNLEANTNEYSLVLFQTAAAFQSPAPQALVSLASSSNRPAISNVLWLEDNDTILFLGERPGEQTQLYSLKCSSKELTKLTSSATYLTSFVTTASSGVIVYSAKNPVSTFLTDSVSRNGIAVTSEVVTDLIRGSYGGSEGDDDSLFVKRLGEEGETRIATQGRTWALPLALSPDGAHLLVQTETTRVSNTWSEYEDRELQMLMRHTAPPGDHTTIYQYELVDTVTGASQVLVDSPIGSYGSEMAWSPDSKSVVVSDVYLPLNVDDPAERALRKAHTFLVEFEVPSRQFVKISHEDLRLLGWDPKTGYVGCDAGRLDSFNGKTTPKAYFRKTGETWSKASAPEQRDTPSLPDIVLEEGMNTPPRIVAIDPSTGRKSLLIDLNPQLQTLNLARVEEIAWKDAHGIEVKGGLYWPPDYVAGKKYPLILQTHGWYSDRFWMDGPYTTGFAAQALAGKGFFVLQLPDPDLKIWFTSKEAPRVMAACESAIDYLDRRGLIDLNRVGITGFSRTYWYVTYTLTHSKHHFAAAAVADGLDYGYLQYILFSNYAEGIGSSFEQVYGGPPYGKSMSRWLKQSPPFLMDRIETPLRIQANEGPLSVLGNWHWYSGLSRLGKPVEMIYIPEGTHVLEKPWDRMTSQQGNVDWFCFWLKGEEDHDPAKVEQYKRWRELRKLRNAQAGGQKAN
jgi:dipeptidyl aminopeptidase/acylaminoacyl peptidase